MTAEQWIVQLRELANKGGYTLSSAEYSELADLIAELSSKKQAESSPLKKWKGRYVFCFTAGDGNRFDGSFDIYADTREGIPEIPHGTIITQKLPDKQNHFFVLDGQSVEEAKKNMQYIHIRAIHRTSDTTSILDEWDFVEKRIEDCVVPSRTRIMIKGNRKEQA